MQSLHNKSKGKLRVVGFVSGSGNTLWKAYEMQKELENTYEGSPFEIVGMFSSKLENKAINFAKEQGIPYAAMDIKEYYSLKGAKITDMEIRKDFDHEILKAIANFKADIILLAGYVWATTDVILSQYTLINVHPADLTIMKDGHRQFAGPNGVGDALSARAPHLSSSAHIATPVLDDGPLLMVSPKIPIDYSLDLEKKDFMRHYLKLVNAQSRMIGARTIYEIAMGHFGLGDNGQVHYMGEPIEQGIRVDDWSKKKLRHERNITPLFEPKGVAVIGASARGGLGNAIVKNMQSLDYTGKVFAVNRGGENIGNVLGFKSILDIQDEIDLAIITVPSPFVLGIAEECGKKGVQAIVCITAGFKEVGEEGAKYEQQLIDIVDQYNMRLMGPNCMGILNTSVNFNATMLHNLPEPGNIAFITQSGALGAGILDFAEEMGLGFSVVASLGNQADITINDIFPYLYEDESTEAILLYLETLTDIHRFIESASKLAEKKPVVLIKSGRTEAGAKAASSHTGSLSENDEILDAIIRKCGIIRVESLEESFAVISAMSKTNRPQGKNVALITNAGGPGILVADALHDQGFKLPVLEGDIKKSLQEVLLPEASTGNPIDLVASAPPTHYNEALKACINSGLYDAIAIVCVPPAVIDTGEVATALVETIKSCQLPVLTSFLGPTLGAGARNVLNSHGIVNLTYPEQISAVFSATLQLPKISFPALERVIPEMRFTLPQGILDQEKGLELVKAYGFAIPESIFLTSEALDSLELDFPVVAKIDHPEIAHKSDVGGVVLNINNLEQLKVVLTDFFTRFEGLSGVIVQEQIQGDIELLLGANSDPQTGHSIFVGLGGILVEILKDYAIGHVPVSEGQIDEMLKSLKAYPLLIGYRGQEGIDIDQLKQLIMNLNQLLLDYPSIKEMDLNPLKYDPLRKKLYVVDTVINI
jgi:acetyl coenzyme A synthetase (ADP forming)-like protein